MSHKFQIFKGVDSQYYFHLKAVNGEIILQSEGYKVEYNCRAGVATVRANAPYSFRYKKLISHGGEPYFTLHASNGEVIGTSQMYKSSAGRDNGIESVQTNAPYAPIENN